MRFSRTTLPAIAPARVAAYVAASVLAILPSVAATYIVPTDDVLIRKADAVVRGRVVDVTSVMTPRGAIVTRTTIQVARVVKGRVAPSPIVVEQPGGEVGDLAEVYPGIGGFAKNEEVFLMLTSLPSGRYRVTDFALGNFTVLRRPDGTEILRRLGLGDAFVLDRTEAVGTAGSGATAPVSAPSSFQDPDRDAAGFERYVVATGSGLSPRMDYVRPPVASGDDRIAGFTYLGEEPPNIGPPARWIQFDSATTVTYKDSAAGDPGSQCVNGCHALVATAPTTWNATPGAQIYLAYGGTDATIGSTCLGDLNNQINFNDPCHQITDLGGLSGCEGTLALGGFSSSSTSGGHPSCPAKNNPTFRKIANGKIMVNNHVGDCLNACDYTSMITHETGHTIGAGHSHDSSALMAPFLNSGICGELQNDDIAFAQCFYPQTALTCDLTASKTWSGPAPLTVTLASGVAGGIQPYVFDYDLGDSTADSGSAPTHTYTTAGTYSVNMTITDAQDQTCEDAVTVTVQPCLPSNVTAASAVVTTSMVKATITGVGFKGGSVVQIDSGGGFVNAPVTKRKTGKKLLAKDVGAIWPVGVPVIVRVLSSTGCPSNPIPAIR